jgi:3-oxoacyl-[acyl-carrier protein] reductase
MRFEDRVAIVTGAARGIGRATALKLAEEGARVAMLDLKEEDIDRTAPSLNAWEDRARPHR